MRKPIDLTGRRFGRLEVIKEQTAQMIKNIGFANVIAET